MTAQIDSLYEQASHLPIDQRTALAGLIVDSLDGEIAPDIEAAWRAEVSKRVAALDAGEVHVVPWSDVRQKLRSLVGL